MEVKASLNNLRISPRKVRLVADLIRGMRVQEAKAQLPFLIKKSSPIILKLLNSAVANAKHNFDIDENNLCVSKIVVDSGATLKRWMPRAMGRAFPIMKRSSSIKLVLDEIAPSSKKARKQRQPQVVKAGEVLSEREEISQEIEQKDEDKSKDKNISGQKPYNASSQSKKRHFSRQSIKRMFRRKSI